MRSKYSQEKFSITVILCLLFSFTCIQIQTFARSVDDETHLEQCSHTTSEMNAFIPFYRDADMDGFGDPGDMVDAPAAPVGYVADNTDCDDGDGTVYPGAPELADNLDNNCDGNIDEGLLEWREIVGYTGMPVPRHESAFVQVGDKFYSLGGRASDRKPIDIYDPATNAWTQGAGHPIEMHHFQAAVLDNLIYVIGGFTGGFPAEVGISNIYIYDPSTDKWHLGPQIPSQRVRGASAAIAYDGKIYIISGATDGHRSGHVTWTDSFDPHTNEWVQLPDAPHARDHFNVSEKNGMIYVAGGRRSSYNNGGLHAFLETAIDVYDVATQTWQTLPTVLPTGRAGTFTSIIGDELFVIGGETGDQIDAYGNTEALDLNTFAWNNYDDMLEPRHGTSAITNNNVVYVAAGSRKQGADEIRYDEPVYFEKFSPTQTYDPAIGAPLVVSSMTGGHDFGFVQMGNSVTVNVNITNGAGTQGLIISDLDFLGLDSDEFVVNPLFLFPADPFQGFEPFVLAPGESLSFQVTFTPNEATIKDAYFLVTHSGADDPQRVPLLATSCNGPVSVGTGDYLENGGLLMMQAESQGPNGWTALNDGVEDFYEWQGPDYFGAGDAGAFGLLTYPFVINTPGTYRFQMRSLQGDLGNTDTQDDIWINFPGATVESVVGGVNTPIGGWEKFYQNDGAGWTWETFSINDGSEIFVTFPAAGNFSLEVSARSQGFNIDKFVLYQGVQNPDNIAESGRDGGTCLRDWYIDADGDGYGDPLFKIQSENPVPGYVANSADCNDSDANINPDAIEIDDGIDNNCNILPDDGWVGDCDTLRINAGSDSSFVTADGRLFLPDNFNLYSSSLAAGNDTLTAVNNTVDSTLYHTVREPNPGDNAFSYSIPLVNGSYEVRLHFTEIYFGLLPGTEPGTGRRVLNADLETVPVLTDYDVVAEAGGPNTAIVETFVVYVSDGVLNIDMTATVNAPVLAAFEIIPQAGCGREFLLDGSEIKFIAEENAKEVFLNWSFASILPHSTISIERKVPSGEFEAIATFYDESLPIETAIGWVDKSPNPGLNQYRLKVILEDGQTIYSDIESVTIEAGLSSSKLYPNPIERGETLKLDIDLLDESFVQVKLVNLLGSVMSVQNEFKEKGKNHFEIETHGLVKGIYLILMESKFGRESFKVTIR